MGLQNHNKGETPYTLVYDTEALLPIEVDVCTIKTSFYDAPSNKTGSRAPLDLIKEVCEEAPLRLMALKQHGRELLA